MRFSPSCSDKSPAQTNERSTPLNVDKAVSQQALDRLTAMQHTSPSTQNDSEASHTTKSDPHKPSASDDIPTSTDETPSTSTPVPRKPKRSMIPSDAPKLSPQRTVAVIYELLYAAVSDRLDYGKKGGRVHKRPGYDARQRVALRFLAEWLDLPWKKVVSRPTRTAQSTCGLQIHRQDHRTA